MPRTRPSLPKLAALGALGASAGLTLLFLLFVWYTAGPGGMDGITTAVAWLSVGGLVAALVAAHLVFARKLQRVDEQQRRLDE